MKILCFARFACFWFVGLLMPPNTFAAEPGTEGTLFLEELTWTEVRDAIKAGKVTVIVPTGGIEQNGPHVITGKHNYIVRATAEATARKLGDTLVAPVVPFVPEGAIDPPGGHMKFAGTISVTEETFVCLLTDIVSSLRAHGFRNIVLIGDSGGNQKGMKKVAEQLNAKWAGDKTRIIFVPEYYDHTPVEKWLQAEGVREKDQGLHDSYAVSATLAAIDPMLIRAKQRQAAGTFKVNAVDLDPLEKTIERGRKIIEIRADATAAIVRKAINSTTPKP
ncbi:creatininase family protein [Zavarzinella formosa]|uniref:creatininase family protein n=1 Tax=Zavarzinella formosa TaxID=360055 RepID=UPI0003060E30|nr:creatininase family protein [Zavarzinella formosa]